MAVVQIQSRSVPLFLRFISSVRPCAHSSSSICSSSVPRGFESRPKLMQNKRRTFITRGRAGPGRAGPGRGSIILQSLNHITSSPASAALLHPYTSSASLTTSRTLTGTAVEITHYCAASVTLNVCYRPTSCAVTIQGRPKAPPVRQNASQLFSGGGGKKVRGTPRDTV